MENIDIETWERREHFRFFLNSDLPFYNINFNIDISGLREKTAADRVSLNNTLVYLTVKSMNKVENFRYRLENDNVVQYDRIDPSFACLRKDEELFRLITVEFLDDLLEFNRSTNVAIANSKSYFDISILSRRSNFVFISALPWIPFTGIDHTLSLNKKDAIPRVSWGRYFKENEKTTLPYNIQVNHIFIDGIHVGKFFQLFQEEIRSYVGSGALVSRIG